MALPADTPEKEALARLFSATSASHDGSGTPLFAYFGERLVELVGLHAGQRVLDVAAGVGATLLPAARRVGESGHVTGIDLAAGMVRQLDSRIADEGLTNAETVIGDGEALPFEEGSFDVVLCGFALFFFDDPVRALDGFRRVLRRGGVLGISTFTRAGSASMDRIWELISAYGEVPPSADPGRRFDEASTITDLLTDAGLVAIDVVESPLEVAYPDVEAWWDWLRSMEFREALEHMDQTTVRHFKTTAIEALALNPTSSVIRFRMDAWLTRCQRR